VTLNPTELMKRIVSSRRALAASMTGLPHNKAADEGGCGVTGFAVSVPVGGHHIYAPSIQMHNRGNGKGGGIAAACMEPDHLGVDRNTLLEDYMLQIALMDPKAEAEVERTHIAEHLEIRHKTRVKPTCDHRELDLPVKPPDVTRYFVRVKEGALRRFASDHGLSRARDRAAEDEFIYQNSFRLNQQFYASMGDQRAFVLSHARDLVVFKIVGYAEQVVRYYGLEDLRARIWIAHQRYPTKGKVWHPAGSHPFIGLNEALVHNGDFANYHSVTEYLKQHNIAPQFLTDTEVSALLFDLLRRVYGYPLEYVIEAMAPTTELDFDRLPEPKRKAYRAIQALHMHGSPDGPWFFIIARSDPTRNKYMLLGITDTSMLRPQVFALQEGDVSIGLVASEKQAIDATLRSLTETDPRFRPVADRYWNARGGSAADGGAFSFTVGRDNGKDPQVVHCADKFGKPITAPPGECVIDFGRETRPPEDGDKLTTALDRLTSSPAATEQVFSDITAALRSWNLDHLRWAAEKIREIATISDSHFAGALDLLTLLNDLRYDCGKMRRSAVLTVVRQAIDRLLASVEPITSTNGSVRKRIDFATRDRLRAPQENETTLVVDARQFEPEGEDCDARLAVAAYGLGWKRFIVYGLRGQRFTGCGFGPETEDVRIDTYGSSGDYLASGIDGMELHVHDSGQDQLAQIMKRGRLVVYGDVGQAFLYGGKGGEIYVMGNAAGRPLINAVGRPRVVINGTALDYLAESFMAGDPLNGGGFVILNGISFDDRGRVTEQPTPYPGSNLFSLASGGAIYVRDPHRKLIDDQLNGGRFTDLTDEDWQLIMPCLENNERFFGISVERDLLTVNGERRPPHEIYRKVRAVELAVLSKVGIPE
jgi:glutamate synthase domain-containing protein 1/glutamate synthase domain-containing protein 3